MSQSPFYRVIYRLRMSLPSDRGKEVVEELSGEINGQCCAALTAKWFNMKKEEEEEEDENVKITP